MPYCLLKIGLTIVSNTVSILTDFIVLKKTLLNTQINKSVLIIKYVSKKTITRSYEYITIGDDFV